MLRIYRTSLEVAGALAPFIEKVGRRNPDLARQMTRAMGSVPLNISEGNHSRGKNRAARWHDAMGSAREVVSCIEVASAMHFARIDGLEPVLDGLDRIVATLWVLIHGTR